MTRRLKLGYYIFFNHNPWFVFIFLLELWPLLAVFYFRHLQPRSLQSFCLCFSCLFFWRDLPTKNQRNTRTPKFSPASLIYRLNIPIVFILVSLWRFFSLPCLAQNIVFQVLKQRVDPDSDQINQKHDFIDRDCFILLNTLKTLNVDKVKNIYIYLFILFLWERDNKWFQL